MIGSDLEGADLECQGRAEPSAPPLTTQLPGVR
jgi:hypothetical protein